MSNKKRGRNTTAPQRRKIIEWYEQVQALGTAKTLSRKLGVTPRAIYSLIHRYRQDGLLTYENFIGPAHGRGGPRKGAGRKKK